MLTRLAIQNFVLIHQATLDVGPGLNVLTGSSGAGKSLILKALQFLLGGRPPAGLSVEKGKTPRITAEFDLPDPAARAQIAQILDLDLADDEDLILTRRLTPAGKTAAAANNVPLAAATLRSVAPLLADLHGQHDQQRLLAPAYHLQLIDRAAAIGVRGSASAAGASASGASTSGASPPRAQTADLAKRYQHWQALLGHQADLAVDADLRRQRLELARFQRDELDAADVGPDELEITVERHQKLAHLDSLRTAAADTVNALTESDVPILDRLTSLTATMEKLRSVDPALDPIVANLSAAAVGLDETARDLRNYVDGLDVDPTELADVEARLTQLRRLADKYGPSTADMLTALDRLGRDIDQLESLQTDTATLAADIAAADKAFKKTALALRKKRAAAIPKLVARISAELKSLGMPRAEFDIEFAPTDAGATGLDRAEFLIRTNPGQSLQPLRKIASGGELSRMLLAIRSVLAQDDATTLLIFDEIDANVGGRAGGVIAQRLKHLARHQQVLCISHLPQVAAFADHHWTVRKHQTADRTDTEIEAMNEQERIAELAEMIGGAHVTATTRKQARELVALAAGHPPRSAAETGR